MACEKRERGGFLGVGVGADFSRFGPRGAKQVFAHGEKAPELILRRYE